MKKPYQIEAQGAVKQLEAIILLGYSVEPEFCASSSEFIAVGAAGHWSASWFWRGGLSALRRSSQAA